MTDSTPIRMRSHVRCFFERWSSSDSSVASVSSVYGSSSSGYYFEIEKEGVGSATISVSDGAG